MNGLLTMPPENHDNFDSKEFSLKVRLIIHIFGAEKIYAVVKEKTVQKWLRGDTAPSKKLSWSLCESLGMTVSELLYSSFDAFPAILARKPGHEYTLEQINNEMRQIVAAEQVDNNNELKGGNGLMPLLPGIINSIHPNTLEKDFNRLKGYYFCYINWINWDLPDSTTASPKIQLYRIIVNIHEYDKERKAIKARVTSKRFLDNHRRFPDKDIWAFKGIVFPLPCRLYFILENPDNSLSDMSFVFIVARDRPNETLVGLVTSETREKRKDPFLPQLESLPASSRAILKKIDDCEVEKGEEYLFEQMGFYEQDDLEDLDPAVIKSLRKDSRNGLLTIF